MEHHHDHNHYDSSSNLLLVFFLNLFFVFIELAGALFTNSVSIFSDAIHDLGDCITILVAYFLEKLAGKKETQDYTYGYKRLSLIGALITSIILVSGSLFVGSEAIKRIIDPEPVKGGLMIIIAIFGLLINSFGAYKLMRHKRLLDRALMLHLLEDVLGWAAVLISAIMIYFYQIYLIDPLLSLAIAAFIMYNAIKNIIRVFDIFLEKTPTGIDYEEVKALISKNNRVLNVHDLHIWTIDGESILLSCHIIIDDRDSDQIIKTINKALEKEKIFHTTIQVEYDEEMCISEHYHN